MANKAYPPSICPGIPRLGKCPSGWTTCTFNDILTVVERLVPIDDDTVYQLVTAKRNRGGIVPREQLKGREIKTQGQYAVRAGDFLIGNRQIIHGACGIVPESLDGAIVSGEYTVLLPKKDLYLPWLSYFAHTVHFQQTCFQSSIGVDVEKMVFKVDWWLKQRLHVPPLAEQKKIVAILSNWDTAIEQTRTLAVAAKRFKKALMMQLLTGQKRLSRFRVDWQRSKLEEVCEINPSLPSHDELGGKMPKSVPFLRMEDVTEDGRIIRYRQIAKTTRSGGYTQFINDDVLVAKITPCFENGKGCQVSELPAPYGLGSTEFHTLRPGPGVTPEILYHITQSQTFRDKGQAFMTGSAGQKRVPAEFIASYAIALPTLPEQRAIAAILSTADDEIRQLEAQAEALERQKKGLTQKLLTGEIRTRQTR